MLDLDQAFGQLRSSLHAHTPSHGPAILALLAAAHQASPARYTQEWLPYIEQHTLSPISLHTPKQLKALSFKLPNNLRLRLNLQYRLSSGSAKTLATLPQLEHLRVLHLPNSFEPGALATFFDAAHLKQLEVLSCDSPHLSAADARALAQSTRLQPTRTLAILNPSIRVNVLLELLSSPHWASLRRVLLYINENASPDERQALFAKLDAINQRSPLIHLSVFGAHTNDLVTITSSSLPKTLQSLDLGVFGGSDPYLVETLGRAAWPSLAALCINGRRLSAASLNALLHASFWPSLRVWGASGGLFEQRAVFSSPRLAQLTHVILHASALTMQDLAALAQNPSLKDLVHLDVGCWDLYRSSPVPSEDALRPLFEPSFRLRSLLLQDRHFSADALVRLFETHQYQGLEHLDLSSYRLDADPLLTRLLDMSFLPSLKRLALRQARLSAAALDALAKSPRAHSLHCLDLRGCPSLNSKHLKSLREVAPQLPLHSTHCPPPSMSRLILEIPQLGGDLDGLEL